MVTTLRQTNKVVDLALRTLRTIERFRFDLSRYYCDLAYKCNLEGVEDDNDASVDDFCWGSMSRMDQGTHVVSA